MLVLDNGFNALRVYLADTRAYEKYAGNIITKGEGSNTTSEVFNGTPKRRRKGKTLLAKVSKGHLV